MVMFEYNRTSQFVVHIFDKSATEIDYIFDVNRGRKDNLNQIGEDAVKIFDEKSPCEKTRLKSTMSSPNSGKIVKTSRIRDVEGSSDPKNLHHCVQAKGSHSEGTNFEMAMVNSVKQEFDEDMVEGNFSTECSKAEQLTLKTNETSITATTFRSKNPHFILVMKTSHVNGYSLRIPTEFAEKYLKKTKAVVHLQVMDERTWPVVYVVPSITTGWNKFASDNNLNIGNVCVFELIKRKENISFKVFIFRVAEESNYPLSKGKNENQSQTIPLLISPCLGMIRPMKEAEKFNSENPIFIVKIKRSFMSRNGPNIPFLFIRKYFEKKKQTVIIQFGKKLWPVSFLHYEYRSSCQLSSGWSLFAEESKLEAGDVCIFELIYKEIAVFGVHVFRGQG
ncbi:putative transcription factor B3-Domain family [Lupinus albus]|uniref:Putative transcription factor B3-Domain family n=1 Tax=Lupinus albus TaxID=3870 RepID=A0A6A4PUW8_LUPAL|nr:putative transcription factor B3-Domain family [Lupinus albus]